MAGKCQRSTLPQSSCGQKSEASLPPPAWLVSIGRHHSLKMDPKNQLPSPPSEPENPPQPPQSVEFSLQPDTPLLELPQQPAPPATTELEDAARKKLITLAQGHLADAYDALLQIAGAAGADSPDKLSKEIQEILHRSDDRDAVFSYDVRFSDKASGEVIRISGHNVLHAYSDATMLSEAPQNFEAMLYTVLFRPLKSKVQSYINSFVTNDNQISADSTLGKYNPRPGVAEARPDGFFANPG
jgi:hypothetical protein